MRRVDNPELKRKMLDHLAERYKIKQVREPNHLSSYIYCRTRTFFDQKQAVEPTDEEVMLFAIGYGLQDVLTPRDAEVPVYEENGITYSPDMSFIPSAAEVEDVLQKSTNPLFALQYEKLTELKTTRRSAKKHYIDEDVPVTWLEYMMGGCYIRKTDQYDLIVLYMMGNYAPPFPQIYCDTFYFEQHELISNWAKIIGNQTVLNKALEDNQPPTPYEHCYDWECKYCRYKLVCETICQVKAQEDKELWE